MKSILAKTPHDSSFSISKRYFNWNKKKTIQQESDDNEEEEEEEEDEEEILTRFASSSDPTRPDLFESQQIISKKKKKKTLEKIRYALTVFNVKRVGYSPPGLGFRVVGTLFGNRRGHVYFSVQNDPTRLPAVLIELPTPTSVLVKEMASGLVRIALECEKNIETASFKEKRHVSSSPLLLEASTWRTYCNGKKCGFAVRRDCGEAEWRVLKSVGPITMGAGVLPAAMEEGNGAVGSEKGELMYMRARFERVIGSKDSEAFYMMNPDGSCGGPELSVYFLRV